MSITIEGLAAGRPRLRLRTKLLVAMIAVNLLLVAVVVATYYISADRALPNRVAEGTFQGFRTDVVSYYREHGTLVGISDVWRARRLARAKALAEGAAPDGPGGQAAPWPPAGGPALIVPYGLADVDGIVLLAGDGYMLGTVAPAAARERGRPIEVDGERIGTALPPIQPSLLNEAREDSARSLNLAVGVAIVLALVVSVLLAGSLARGVRESLARRDWEREQRAAEIAHELKTPLTAISAYVEAMRDGDLAPTAARLDTVYREAHQLGKIIEDLRLLPLSNAGALTLRRVPTQLSDLVRHSVGAHAAQAARRGVELRAEIDSALPPVDADPIRVQQVVEILVSNALRHTTGGQIVVSAACAGDAAVIRVADTGAGIHPEVLPRIFDRLYRGPDAVEQDSQGSGLGLAIAKAIVGAHDGQIEVTSELRRGTVFTIALPLSSGAAEVMNGQPYLQPELVGG